MGALKWSRVRAGHYYARRWNDERQAMDQIHVVEYVKGDWELKVNGEHVTYSGTKRGAQARAQTPTPREDSE